MDRFESSRRPGESRDDGKVKIGILGGTFDPVHNAHLKLAQEALRQLKLDRVYLVLSPRSPFKLSHPLTPSPNRLSMLRLALKGKSKLKIGTWELKRRGPSYTVDTLADYRKLHPKHDLFLIMGSDAMKGFMRWKNPEKVLRLSTLVVGRRPGIAVPGHPVAVVLRGIFPKISSTALRRSFAGKKKGVGVPAGVARYILKNGLYA